MKITASRNVREGRYAGRCLFGHVRVGSSGEMLYTKRIRAKCAQYIAVKRIAEAFMRPVL